MCDDGRQVNVFVVVFFCIQNVFKMGTKVITGN